MFEQNKKFNKEIDTAKKTENLEIKNKMTDVRNSIESFKRRLEHAKERISDLKGRTFEIIQSEEQKEKRI